MSQPGNVSGGVPRLPIRFGDFLVDRYVVGNICVVRQPDGKKGEGEGELIALFFAEKGEEPKAIVRAVVFALAMAGQAEHALAKSCEAFLRTWNRYMGEALAALGVSVSSPRDFAEDELDDGTPDVRHIIDVLNGGDDEGDLP